MRARALAPVLVVLVGCVACGGQKTEATTPVPSASASSATVAPPPAGDAGAIGKIDPDSVRGVIRAATPRFMICYIAGLKKDKKLAGRVETKFVINETGHVDSVEDVTHSNVLPDDATRDCIVSKFKQLEFPPPQPSGKVPITYPLLLDPSMVQLAEADAGAPATTPEKEYGHERKPFNPGAVAAALGKIDVKDCAKSGGFHGTGHIKLTFDPSGVVTKTEIDSPPGVDKTAAGACVAKLYGAARVPAFDGTAATIGKSFTVP